jgi:uncharacterized protein (DUF1015 family)
MRQLLEEITKHTIHKLDLEPSLAKMKSMSTSEVHEDNSGCIVLATKDQYMIKPRTKHLAVKWHHFRDQVRYGHIKVTKIESAYNWADILTKATDKTTFERLRYLLMGW